ncbi:ImmA/IrrE family metallo-endopeptidase [Clostridium rectalis]|uniref:ImmA/IrrE family metallo-endopeptidase n=1 Tax=Clostridium rectalis TaxID=2040295 RepID=UPI000F640F24|nr:ImmA/IrrE family metallo-endopeptidase [Clostridium rectalis]
MNKIRKLAIEKIADSVRDECSMTGYGFQNIFEAAGKIGYRVIRYPIGSDAFLGFALIKDTERIIFSNSSLILSREIFSIAHEIGHQKLHLKDQGLKIIKDDDFNDRDEFEIEANYFAACLLMPREKVEKFIRLELDDKDINRWSGLDIARIQTEFNVSYDMAIIRLKELRIFNNTVGNELKLEKIEKKISRLLNAINGNVDLCKPAEVKKVPADYLEWVISNYTEKLIPVNSLEKVLKYVDLNAEDLENLPEDELEEDESLDDLIGRMD